MDQTRVSASLDGLGLGLIGVAIFGLTLPFTRLAVSELDPVFVGLGRAVVAAVLAAFALLLVRARVPPRESWWPLARYSAAVIIGFPLLATIAMKHAPAAHGGIVLALLPLATAIASTIVASERPSVRFWLAAACGSLTVLVFVLTSDLGGTGQALSIHWADGLLFASVGCAAWGYAEGGVLARTIGGWRTISWALVFSVPIVLVLTIALSGPVNWSASTPAWIGFFYVASCSMFLGFFAWNRGLAIGGIARVGQLQLLQTFVTLIGAAVLLGERIRAAGSRVCRLHSCHRRDRMAD